MYLISPSSVDLDWYSSDEAMDMDSTNQSDRTFFTLTATMNDLKIEFSKNELELCKVGDPSSCQRFLCFLRGLYEKSIDRIAPAAERHTLDDLEELNHVKKINNGEDSANITETDCPLSDVRFHTHQYKVFLQDSLKMDVEENYTTFV